MSEIECLPLDSPRWAELHHAYGPGTEVAAWIAAIEAERIEFGRSPIDCTFDASYLVDMFWAALCHQGDVYSGTFAAVPHFVRLSERVSRKLRIKLLNFVGVVLVNATDRFRKATPDDLLALCEKARPRALELALDLLPSCECPEETRDLLKSVAGLTDNWWFVFHEFGESVQLDCPGDHSFFVDASGGGFARDGKPFPIAPPAVIPPWDGRTLRADNAVSWVPLLARRAGQEELARQLELLIAGTCACPSCGRTFTPW